MLLQCINRSLTNKSVYSKNQKLFGMNCIFNVQASCHPNTNIDAQLATFPTCGLCGDSSADEVWA